MNRVRPVEALLAALATLAVTLPLTTLFTPSTWFRAQRAARRGRRPQPAWACGGITANRPLVVVGQVAAPALHARRCCTAAGHLFGRPPADARRPAGPSGSCCSEAQQTVTNYTAPAPSNRGTILAISLLIGLTARRRRRDRGDVPQPGAGRHPPAVGLPRARRPTPATGSAPGTPCPAPSPGSPSSGGRACGRCGPGAPRPRTRPPGPLADPTTAFATTRPGGRGRRPRRRGRAARAGPAPADDLPRRRAGPQRQRPRRVRLRTCGCASSVDIARDLGSRSTDPVLRYRSTSDRLEPLRVGILDTYRRGQWQSQLRLHLRARRRADPRPDRRARGAAPGRADLGGRQRDRRAPGGAAGGRGRQPLPGRHVEHDRCRRRRAAHRSPSTSYTAEFVELDPEDSQFTADLDEPAGSTAPRSRSTRAPRPRCAPCSTEITDDGDSPLEVARAIQAYLRGPQFTYSLELAEQAADGNLSDEPLARFLETKRGYCVQFTSAMIMLARAAGIPARMAVGFLPGVADGDDRVVRVCDAHAWPELYFPRLGWVRFEPTPGTRSGVAPEYSLVPTDTGSSVERQRRPRRRPRRRRRPRPGRRATSPTSLSDRLPAPRGVGVVRVHVRPARHDAPRRCCSCCSSLAVVPFGAWLARRRASARRRATTPTGSRPSGSRCCCGCRTSGSCRPTGRPRARRPARSGTTPTSPPTRTTPSAGW